MRPKNEAAGPAANGDGGDYLRGAGATTSTRRKYADLDSATRGNNVDDAPVLSEAEYFNSLSIYVDREPVGFVIDPDAKATAVLADGWRIGSFGSRRKAIDIVLAAHRTALDRRAAA